MKYTVVHFKLHYLLIIFIILLSNARGINYSKAMFVCLLVIFAEILVLDGVQKEVLVRKAIWL
jgi:hypothetical protein